MLDVDSFNNNNLVEYKQCAGKNCKRNGVNRLKILIINKIGYFCDSCRDQLLALEIVIKEENLK
jgi:hypothetical protein